jgi:arsenate reductase
MKRNSEKIKILVLCTGNSCRSQMAEGFFRYYGGEKIGVKSAGLESKGVNPLAIHVMKEVGIDISGNTSNHLNEYINEDFDYVITVCDNAAANCPTWPKKTTRLHWPFPDPAHATGTEAEILHVFRKVRDGIGEKVKGFCKRLG